MPRTTCVVDNYSLSHWVVIKLCWFVASKFKNGFRFLPREWWSGHTAIQRLPGRSVAWRHLKKWTEVYFDGQIEVLYIFPIFRLLFPFAKFCFSVSHNSFKCCFMAFLPVFTFSDRRVKFRTNSVIASGSAKKEEFLSPLKMASKFFDLDWFYLLSV